MPQIEQIKSKLEQAQLAGFLFKHSPELLVLQAPLNDDTSMLKFLCSMNSVQIKFGYHLA